MSTQRREDRRQLCTEFAKEIGQIWLMFLARFVRAIAAVGTARLSMAQSPEKPSLATNSLHLGQLHIKSVGQNVLRTPAPVRAWVRDAVTARRSWTEKFSNRLAPTPSEFESRPYLPHYPAGQCRWTERYDGKRDLYLLHAA